MRTPNRFGKINSQAVMGLQMGFAYTGTTFMPPLFGFLASDKIFLMPAVIAVYIIIMFVFSEKMNSFLKKNNKLS
ncbi:hypothetical protein [Elusimicrobium minutum]|nr:hypothetical protein [Elusimicrobium minutum]